MRRLLTRLRDRRGVSALEFAVILPLLVIVFAGVFDLGNALQQSIRLEAAARAAAQYAFSNPQDREGIEDTVYRNLSSIPRDQLNVRVEQQCLCAAGGEPTGCSETCTQPGLISIRVSRPFEFFSPVSEVVMPNLSQVRGNAEIRLY